MFLCCVVANIISSWGTKKELNWTDLSQCFIFYKLVLCFVCDILIFKVSFKNTIYSSFSFFPPLTVYVYLYTYVEAAVWVMVDRLRNANVSSVAFVRNTVIRPPAPWVEPLTAPAPALIYFDVNRKVSWVPEGSCRDVEWCVWRALLQRRSSRIPDGAGGMAEGGRALRA